MDVHEVISNVRITSFDFVLNARKGFSSRLPLLRMVIETFGCAVNDIKAYSVSIFRSKFFRVEETSRNNVGAILVFVTIHTHTSTCIFMTIVVIAK